MLKRNYYILLSIIILTFTSCVKEPIEIVAPDSGKLQFTLRAVSADIQTRATSTPYEESLMTNAFIMLYRFPNGYSTGADPYNVDDEELVQTWQLNSEDILLDRDAHSFTTAVDVAFVTAGDTDQTVYTLFAIVNYGDNNAIMSLSQESINAAVATGTWDALSELDIEMKPTNLSVERGTNFLMRGIVPSLTKDDLVSVAGQVGDDIVIDLKRIDAKFSFKLLFTSNVVPPGDPRPASATSPRKIINMRTDYWQVHNIPRKVNLVSGTRVFSDTEDEVFTSPIMNFEGIGEDAGAVFSFYIMPQSYIVSPENSIKALFSNVDSGSGVYLDDVEGYDNIDQYSFVYNDDGSVRDYLRDTDGNRIIKPDGYVDFFRNPKIPLWQYKSLTLREHQIRNNTSTLSDSRTNFTYAPDKAPYVEFFAELEYDYFDIDTEVTTRYVTDMRVLLHLGMGKRTTIFPTGTIRLSDGSVIDTPPPFDLDENNTTVDVDDYDIVENTQYNYNLYWDGSASIIAEATSNASSGLPEMEYTPGMEGQVYAPRIYRRINSGNDQFIYSMPDLLVNPLMGWALSSPFGQWTAYDLYNPNPTRPINVNGDIENIDYKWVHFAVNPKNGTGHSKMRIFPGNIDKRPDMYYGAEYSFIETKEVPMQGGGTMRVPVYRNEASGLVVEKPITLDGTYYGTFAPNDNYWEFLETYNDPTKSTKLLNIDQMMQIAYLNKAGYIQKNSAVPDVLSTEVGSLPSAWHTIGTPPMSQPDTPIEGSNTPMSSINMTAFVNEFYYYIHPLKYVRDGGGDHSVEGGLWKHFVNRADKRVFSVVSPPQISNDYLSQYVASSTVFEQEPIQTYYNLNNAGLDVPEATAEGGEYWSTNRQYTTPKYIVYGYEGFMEEETFSVLSENGESNSGAGIAGIFPSALNQSSNDYGIRNIRSGLRNTQLQWLRNFTNGKLINGNNVVDWSKFIDRETWELKYDIAIYQCLKRNRDEDGDGKLDVDEIKWYAPAITQLGYQWIGAGALSLEGQPYFNDDFSQTPTALFSSTYIHSYDTTLGKDGGHMLSWVNQGYSVSNAWDVMDFDPTGFLPGRPNNSVGWIPGVHGRRVHVRCFRNIGTPKSEEGKMLNTMLPQEHEFVKAIVRIGPYVPDNLGDLPSNTVVYKMKLVNIDPVAYRRYSQVDELPMHHVFEDHNKPWSEFEVIGNLSSTTYDNGTSGLRKATFTAQQLDDYFPKNTFWGHMNAINTLSTEVKQPCPKGWRMPNQREASIMQMMLQKRVSSTSSADYTSYNENTDEGWGNLTKINQSGSQIISGPNPEIDRYVMTRTYGLKLKTAAAVPSTPAPLTTLPQNGETSDNLFETYGITIDIFDETTIGPVIGVNDFTRMRWLDPDYINSSSHKGRARCVRDVN